MRDDERQVDRARKGKSEGASLPALDRGGKRLGAKRAFVTLLQERMHALAEIGHLRVGPLPSKQVAAKLAFELLDRAGKRRLRDMALFCRSREIERLGNRQEVADLMHF